MIYLGISDLIECFINETLSCTNGCVEIQRAELAQKFKCVPSQINYVISTRFSPEHGYTVESRRGGGGYIRITRMCFDLNTLRMNTVNAIGTELSLSTFKAFLSNLLNEQIIDTHTASLIIAATSENALKPVPAKYRDSVRASIFKQMLVNASSYKGG